MCGIAGIHFKRPGALSPAQTERFVNCLLLGIEHRGTDATGIVSVAPGGKKIVLSKEALAAEDFIKIRPSLGDDPLRSILLHTRFATQGHQSRNVNNHPVLHGTTFVTHNGHIGNDADLFKANEIERLGEVDSEVIAALINKVGFDNVCLALQELQGGFAIAAIDAQTPDKLVLAKGNSSPLVIFENKDFIVWASLREAIEEAWGATLGTPPRKWKFQEFKPGQILMFNGAERELLEFKVKAYPSRVVYAGYEYFGGRSTYTSSGYGATLREEEKNEICFCGHRRFFHKGLKYNEACLDKSDAIICSCQEFLAVPGDNDNAGSPSDQRSSLLGASPCDGCNTWVLEDELEYVLENYWLCDDCYEEYGAVFTDDDKEAAKAAVAARVNTVPGTDLVIMGPIDTEESCSVPLRLVPASKRGGDSPLFEDGLEMMRHNYILREAAVVTGFNSSFIEWILFRSDITVVNNDVWLREASEVCDTAYAEAEESLNKLENTVTAENFLLVLA